MADRSLIRRVLAGGVAVTLMSSIAPFASVVPSAAADAAPVVHAQVPRDVAARLAASASNDEVTVIVKLREQASLTSAGRGTRAQRQRAVVRELRDTAARAQAPIRRALDRARAGGRVHAYTPLWGIDAVIVTAAPDVITELAARPDVESITPDAIDVVPAGTPSAPPEPGIAQINAPSLWSQGVDGSGVLVASLDSGVDLTDLDLATNYRGGTNSWYDPYGQHTVVPFDATGHGTATMGVMVGGGSGGSTIGVAPGATWIAARIFDDNGNATASAIHLAMQWVLDPDGDPATADAPSIVNNSWSFGSPGCNLEFRGDVQAMRVAGIVPVFAAGNFGSGMSTSVSPANYPEAVAVGAIDSQNRIWSGSSRGPSACGEAPTTYPDVVAPGVNVWTTDLGGLYSYWTGTSIAAPSVSGAIALLSSSMPGSDFVPESALLGTAVDIGAAGPDNVFGRGRIDVAAASIALGGTPPSTTTTTTTTLPPTTTTTTLPPTTTTTTLPPTTTTTTTTLPPTTTTTTTTTLPPTTTTTTVPGPGDVLFADGFESGSTVRWSTTATNGGRLSVNAGAALSGTFGASATISNRVDTYVEDASPNAVMSYHARFQFDPNGVVIGSGKTHVLVAGHAANGNEIAVVQIRRVSVGYEIRTGARLDGGTVKYGAWAAIGDAPHTIELGWSAATGTGRNGTVGLWVDGTAGSTLSGLTNGSGRVEAARLGPQSIPSGVSGTEYFDSFASTTTRYIGP